MANSSRPKRAQERVPEPILRELARAHGQKAVLTRHHGPDDPRTLAADAELRTAKLAEHIRRAVDAAPALTPEQRDRLAGLLRGGGDAR